MLQCVVMVMQTKVVHVMYNLHEIFTIIVPQHPDGPSISTHMYNLYTEYGKLTVEQVALSNEWYFTWTSQPWFCENLAMSGKQLKNSMKNCLWTKVYETYKMFPTCQQGGLCSSSLL